MSHSVKICMFIYIVKLYSLREMARRERSRSVQQDLHKWQTWLAFAAHSIIFECLFVAWFIVVADSTSTCTNIQKETQTLLSKRMFYAIALNRTVSMINACTCKELFGAPFGYLTQQFYYKLARRIILSTAMIKIRFKNKIRPHWEWK